LAGEKYNINRDIEKYPVYNYKKFLNALSANKVIA
jgi:hypothetical protein